MSRTHPAMGHHILCAGDYSIPYARLAAECLARTIAPKIFIHLDSIPARLAENACAWLAEVPGTITTQGLFGLRAGDKIPGRWHQRMVNRVCQIFRSEPALAIVDADFFLTDAAWGGHLTQAARPEFYSVTYRMRKERILHRQGRDYSAINTILFTLRPGLHLDLNLQEGSQDASCLAGLVREFPGATIDTGHQVDSMMHASWRAQLLGYQIQDLSPSMLGCHVGGFSHMKPSKLAATESRRLHTWISRIRLARRVWDFMAGRGWSPFMTVGMKTNLISCEKALHTLPPGTEVPASPDELAWSGVEPLFL